MAKDIFEKTEKVDPNDENLGDDFFNEGSSTENIGRDTGDTVINKGETAQEEDDDTDYNEKKLVDNFTSNGADDEFPYEDDALDTGETKPINYEKAVGEQNQTGKKKEDDEKDDIELDALNKVLDTSYSSMKELKDALKKQDEPKIEEDPKEVELYEKNKNVIAYLGSLKAYNDETLVREHFHAEHKQNTGNDVTDDEKDEIDLKISNMKENGNLSLLARSVRNDLTSMINDRSSQNAAIDQKKETAKEQTIKQKRESIRDYYGQVFKEKNFYGIEPTEKDIREAYSSVTTNKFIEEVQNDPKLQAELSLMRLYKEQIRKKASGKSYSDGVDSIMKDLDKESGSRNNRNRHSAGQVGQSGRRTDSSLVSSFIQ